MRGTKQLGDGATSLLQQIGTGGAGGHRRGLLKLCLMRLQLLRGLLLTAEAAATATQRLHHVLLHVFGGVERGHGPVYPRHAGRRMQNGRSLPIYAARGQGAFPALLLVIIMVVAMSTAVVHLLDHLLALHVQVEAHVGGCRWNHLAVSQFKVSHVRFGIRTPINNN